MNRQSFHLRRSLPYLCLAFLIAASTHAVAGAEESNEAVIGPVATSQMLEAAAARAAYEAAQARRQTAEARAERVRSRTAYRGLGREEALALAKGKLGEVFANDAFRPWEPPTAMHVKRYAGKWGALLEGQGDEPLFVEAMGAPLTSELGSGERQPVDLTLEPIGAGAFAPRNPNVPTRVESDGSVSFAGSHTAIRVEGATPDAPVETNRRLFYANALRDTDMAIAPIPGGASFSFSVRSADAPEQAALDFELPAGVHMRMAGNVPGVVEVVRGTKVVGHVNPPAAWDADGEPIAVGYQLDGDRLLVSYPHRRKDLAYPLYVDPDYEDWGYTGFDWSGWNYEEAGSTAFTGGNVSGYLRVSNAVGSFNNGSFGAYRFANPRGYIKQLEGGWVSVYHAFTCDNLGILVPDRTTWKARYSAPNCAGVVTNAMPVVTNTDTRYGDHAMMQHWMNTTGQRNWVGYIQMYSVQLTYADNELPTVTSVANSTNGAWKKPGDSVTITPKGYDQGMGIYSFNLYPPQVAPIAWLAGCNGTHQGGRCPNGSATAPVGGGITYTVPSNTDEGALSVGGEAMDLLGKRKQFSTTVKVDRFGPAIDAPGGSLAAAEDGFVYGGPYTLTVNATDGVRGGTAAEQRSGVESVKLAVNGLTKPEWIKTNTGCTGDSCPLSTTITFDPAAGELADGPKTATITATDRLGHTSTRSFSFTLDRTGDVYHARKYDGTPGAGGAFLGEEWNRLGTSIGRFQFGSEEIATRGRVPCDAAIPAGAQCDEFRSVTTNPTTFEQHRGTRIEDPHLPWRPELRDAALVPGSAAGTGALSSILQSWQTPPPGQSSQYLRFETNGGNLGAPSGDDSDDSTVAAGADVTYKVWVEANSKLPVKATEVLSTGQSFSSYWTYDKTRPTVTELPADFFLVAKPTSPVLNQSVDYRSAEVVGAQTDLETGEAFDTYALGGEPVVTGTRYCLSTIDAVTMEEDLAAIEPEAFTDNWTEANPDGPAEDPADLDADDQATVGTDAPDPRGPDTFTSSNYRVVDEGEICDPGADAEPDPELAVASLAADSSLAVSLRSAHDPETLGTQSQPFVDDLTRSGVQEVTTEDGTMTAYVVPVGGDESSAYIAHPDGVTRSAGAGGTDLVITGPFEPADINDIASLLEVH